MRHEVDVSRRFEKDKRKCQKRGYNLNELDKVIEILRTRKFTQEEVTRYKPHYIEEHDVYELHLNGRKSDWVLTYNIIGDVLYLQRTGSHDDLMLSTEISNELIWL